MNVNDANDFDKFDDFDDAFEYDSPEYSEECMNVFDVIDSILVLENLSNEDEKILSQMDLTIAESNQVTEDQFKTLDILKEKYKVSGNE